METNSTPDFDPEFLELVEQAGGLEFFEEKTGLGLEELSTSVKFGDWEGTLADAIMDEKCPVGRDLMDAYANKGIDGVQNKLNKLCDYAEIPQIVVTENSRRRDAERRTQNADTPDKTEKTDKDDKKPESEPPKPSAKVEAVGKKVVAETVVSQTEPDRRQIERRQAIEEARSHHPSNRPDEPPQAIVLPFRNRTEDINLFRQLDEANVAVATLERSNEVTAISSQPAVKETPIHTIQSEELFELTEPALNLEQVSSTELDQLPAMDEGILNEGILDAVWEAAELPADTESEVAIEERPEEATAVPELKSDSEVTLTESILTSVAETGSMSMHALEQTEQVLVNLPEEVGQALDEYLDEAEPEVQEQMVEMLVRISAAADRLNDLVTDGKSESVEAVRIEALLQEWYEELLEQIGFTEANDELIVMLISAIKSDDFKPKATDHLLLDEFKDEMHERLFGTLARIKADLKDMRQRRLANHGGRLAIQLSAN